MFKVTRYIRWTRALSTINRTSLKLRKYVASYLHRNWPWLYYLKINSGFHAQKESQALISASSHVQWSFIHQKPYLCLQPCSLDNTLKKPSSVWQSFNIRQKLGLFVLGVTHKISNLPITHSLRQIDVSGWVGLALWY